METAGLETTGLETTGLQSILVEAEALKGLLTAYIADSQRGTVIASYNPGQVNRDGLGAHTAEVLRALTRLHSVLHHDQADSSYFVSNSQSERLMVQLLSEGYYLAFAIHTQTNYAEAVAMFKTILKKCQMALTPNTNFSSAEATAPSSQ
jgi:predicted regulator of Ras-like GTPase activity (Roadblock/LC7/MglB family)